MTSKKRVLVAVKDADAASRPMIDKAAHIAGLLGAPLELFHAISTSSWQPPAPRARAAVTSAHRAALDARAASLEQLARRARRQGVDVRVHVTWDESATDAIARRAARVRAGLIVAGCHEGRGRPWQMGLAEWDLLRQSPCPVLLLKTNRRWREPVILAAVDPAHAHAKPARLDTAIVAHAAQLARLSHGSFELVHANFPAAFALLVGEPALDNLSIARVYEAQKLRSRMTFERFAKKAGVPPARRHLVDSEPAFAIPHVARKVGADLVVMGAVSRSAIKRALIGNTAERVLDALPCDVLVVKPPGRVPIPQWRWRATRAALAMQAALPLR
jgi:universal stress protein E